MTKIFTLSILLTTLLIQSCKKDNVEPKPAVADIPLAAFDMRSVGDTAGTDLPYPSTLTLNSDKTWTINCGGAISKGTYIWTPTVTYTAYIKFNITQWTPLSSDTLKSTKLKNILLSVDKCEFPGTTIFGVNFSANNYMTYIRTSKQ
jgi:hypothetical protein